MVKNLPSAQKGAKKERIKREPKFKYPTVEDMQKGFKSNWKPRRLFK